MNLFRTHRIDTLVFSGHFGTSYNWLYMFFTKFDKGSNILHISTFYKNMKYFNIIVDALFSAILH